MALTHLFNAASVSTAAIALTVSSLFAQERMLPPGVAHLDTVSRVSQFTAGVHTLTPEAAASAEQACSAIDAAHTASPDISTFRRAMSVLMRCPISGPGTLAALWTRGGTDTDATLALTTVSRQFLDERLANAVLQVFRDRTRPVPYRTRAAEALIGQMGVNISLGELVDPPRFGGRPGFGVWRAPGGALRGDVPLTDAAIERLYRGIEEVALSDDDEYIVEAAKLLLIIYHTERGG